MSEKYGLDACSVIAYYTQEDGGDTTKSLISDAIEDRAELFIHKVNLYEVVYDIWRTEGEATALNILGLFKKLPISIIESISDELLLEAARMKTKYRISVADSFALALARLEDATLVTSDHHEFDPIDAAGELPFLWIR